MSEAEIRLYTAGLVVPGGAPPIESGALLVQGDRILACGRRLDMESLAAGAEHVDFADAIIVPLLVNAHTHLELTDFPRWAAEADCSLEHAGFVDWIIALIGVKSGLGSHHFQTSLRNGIDQSIRAGTGVVGDILAHHGSRNVYRGTPLAGTLFLETLGQKAEIIARLKGELDKALQDASVGAVDLGLSPHSPYTISASYLKQIYARCQNEGLRCTTHIAESPEEAEFLRRGKGAIASTFYPHVGWEGHIPATSGLSPVDYLAAHGGLFTANLLVHGVQLTKREIRTIADAGMSLVLCPRSNACLKVGKAPVAALLDAGVQLALGTDSLASCDSLSIWDEMSFAHSWFDGQVDAPTLFHMATLGGARALGLERTHGTLSPGKTAGFQVLQPSSLVASADVFDYFVSPACAKDLVQVYHHGQARLSGLADQAG